MQGWVVDVALLDKLFSLVIASFTHAHPSALSLLIQQEGGGPLLHSQHSERPHRSASVNRATSWFLPEPELHAQGRLVLRLKRSLVSL